MAKNNKELLEKTYGFLAEDEDARFCKDIPDSACNEQPKAFVLHLLSLVLTKWGDSLVSARLVLPWILTAGGAPSFLIGLLVPLRESLALLPQLFVAQRMREFPVRKWFWVGGSIGQAFSLLAMTISVITLEGAALGYAIVSALIVFSIARGVCSVASKDVMGKSVSKTRRGRLTGLASSAAGLMTLSVALIVIFAPEVEGSKAIFAALLGGAALLWLLAALLYANVPEVAGATAGGGNAIAEAIKSLSLLQTDAKFRQFVTTRALLIASAFAIPYMVVLIQREGSGALTSLGGLMLASGAAGLFAGRFWGRWSDSSSNQVMAAAALLSSFTMAATVLLQALTASWLGVSWVSGILIFIAAIAHQGARIGRKTYLVDMATQENRAQYTAVSNTVIGILLLLGGGLGVVDQFFGSAWVLILLSIIGVFAAAQAFRLPALNSDD
ncbi:hypothetical protein Ga0003345_1086 [Idiomarinaceae bacterium HL-53]|nr:hypothetical protein Ga0003345_1086 [Idiomarinaceae bacterium HL-53]